MHPSSMTPWAQVLEKLLPNVAAQPGQDSVGGNDHEPAFKVGLQDYTATMAARTEAIDAQSTVRAVHLKLSHTVGEYVEAAASPSQTS